MVVGGDPVVSSGRLNYQVFVSLVSFASLASFLYSISVCFVVLTFCTQDALKLLFYEFKRFIELSKLK